MHIQSFIFTKILQGSPNITWTTRGVIAEFTNFLKGRKHTALGLNSDHLISDPMLTLLLLLLLLSQFSRVRFCATP